VFVAGLVLISLLPIPLKIKGGLRTDMVTISSGKNSGTILLTTKLDGNPSFLLTGANGKGTLLLTCRKKAIRVSCYHHPMARL